ncbi:low molecular weight protein arginine phosphatase [Heyndrickxia ginsengihumi]|uniref:Low molecular weight protein arginine phosphatase n=1 Tax=Heyndrickxia ginsengihumi TaxID=363870 RepID=A0A0A6Y360_9BACI|nr:low molecular weight protein arginine phosphatase [Heyndrickxia ginsengihumi]KHD86702.1 hypothetical protein NG54_01135 [Heyndrickxia ginsengihumi]MBE6184840.1 low molecular weight protein arginine phosphatase [Bacillus sp. (in: firmicutes)]MCM3022166.1 low molecular weight protein arginine phosphatase [Heyndrickxia ginsengihumi]NEY18397.1 low molecular weight protein arginine phosphatase [Heyndrickxia ginsengihumi]
MNILFVCTGNTCRSPMAEAILHHKNIDGIDVRSAGVFAMNGQDPSYNALQVLKEQSIEHKKKARMLTENDIDWATYILTMTLGHKEAVIKQFPNASNKTFTLKEFVNGEHGDITDPYGGSLEIYRKTYHELYSLINHLVQKLYPND